MKAYVPEVSCSKKRIADGVQQYIGIAVANASFFKLQLYSSQPQFASFSQRMHIVAKANSYIRKI
jgi:hypothetical protein